METIGLKLTKLRNQHRQKQHVIANLLGVSQTTISNLEQNIISPTLYQLKLICKHYNVSINYFLDIENEIIDEKIDQKRYLEDLNNSLIAIKEAAQDFKHQLKDKNQIINYQDKLIADKELLINELLKTVSINSEKINLLELEINLIRVDVMANNR